MTTTNEQWKTVEGYPNYEVSNLGFVRNNKGKFLKLQEGREGYQRVGLSNNGRLKMMLVSRLVAKAFIPNSEELPCVNHINGIKSNNSVLNLEWVTRSENTKHAYRTGLKKGLKGIDNPRAKINEECVKFIRNNTHLLSEDIEQMFGISQALVSLIRNKKIWKHI